MVDMKVLCELCSALKYHYLRDNYVFERKFRCHLKFYFTKKKKELKSVKVKKSA